MGFLFIETTLQACGIPAERRFRGGVTTTNAQAGRFQFEGSRETKRVVVIGISFCTGYRAEEKARKGTAKKKGTQGGLGPGGGVNSPFFHVMN